METNATMTDQHPLTDDIIRYDKKLGCQDFGTWIYTENDLRAAYDLAVDEAVNEFGYALYVLSQNQGDILDKQEISDLVREFQETLRPQQQKNNQ